MTLNTKTDYRTEFSTRLRVALEKAGLRNSPTELSRLFNGAFKGDPITVHAARKWLVGEAVPTHEKLVVLAQLLQTTPNALAWGDEPDDIVTTQRGDTRLMLTIQALPDPDKELVEGFVAMLSRRRRHSAKREGA